MSSALEFYNSTQSDIRTTITARNISMNEYRYQAFVAIQVVVERGLSVAFHAQYAMATEFDQTMFKLPIL